MGHIFTTLGWTFVLLHLAFASIIDDAKFIFTFGDSYTTEGFTGIGNPLSPQFPICSTAGPNWARQFVNMTGHVQLINIAVSGATSNNDLVAGSPPDFKSQTSIFLNYIFPPPANVPWTRSNAIFMISFGTNDVNNSYKMSAGNGTALYSQVLDSYFASVERLYAAGARQFVFNNVVPFDRAQTGVQQGPALQFKLKQSILEFNRQLSVKAATYCSSKTDIRCSVYDTHAIFTLMMDYYRIFEFATPYDYCPAYAVRFGCEVLPADSSCLGPVSAYVWKDNLHPTWAADTLWARGLHTQLSTSVFL